MNPAGDLGREGERTKIQYPRDQGQTNFRETKPVSRFKVKMHFNRGEQRIRRTSVKV